MKKTLALILALILTFALAASASAEITGNLRILYPGTSDLEREIATDIDKAIKEKNPGINTEFLFLVWADIETQLAVMTQSQDYPDVMQIQDVVNPVAMGALEPIQSYIESSETMSLDDFAQVALEKNSVDGVLYAVPMSLIPYSHIINKDLFEKAGIDPASLKNWDDVKAAVAAISADGTNGYAMANGGEGRFCFRDFMMIALANGFTPDDTSEETKKAYVEALQLIADMAPYMPKAQSTWLYPELFKAWENGTTAMMHTGSYFTANVVAHGTKAMDFTQILPLPAGPSAEKPTLMVGTNGYAMIAGSEQKDAAWAFIEAAMSEPVLGKLCGSLNAPAVNYLSDEVLVENATKAYAQYGEEVGAKHIRIVKEFQAAANEYGTPMPAILGQPAMEKVVQGAIVKLTDGQIDAEAAYEEIKKGIDEVKAGL